MTRSHRCWFITNIWKSDHHLNITLGTDKNNTLSPFYMLNHWFDESEFCLISRLKSFEARTIWLQMGRAYLVTRTVLCFQCHTHQSLQHSEASRYFQTVVEPSVSVHNLRPSKVKALPLCPDLDRRKCTFAHFTARWYDSTCAFLTDCHDSTCTFLTDCHDITCTFPTDCHDSTCTFLTVTTVLVLFRLTVMTVLVLF